MDDFLREHENKLSEDVKRFVVRNSYLPSRKILTGAGKLEVEQPRVRDNSSNEEDRARFSSAILPPYLPRSKSIDELLPGLYLKGISTGDFSEAMQALLGAESLRHRFRRGLGRGEGHT